MEFTRRNLFKISAGAVVAGAVGRVSMAADDPLPSWNDGPTKKAILDFVHATTDRMSSRFVPESERIATFDQDGTLWVEHPMFKILAATLTGMSVDQFEADTKHWLEKARDPRWKRPYTELTYVPMTEVLTFMRSKAYGIPPEQVVGTA